MVVHLIVNSSVINGAATFQNNVLNIHKLGALLPLVEWTFIFIPILFHMIFGFVIIAGGMPNPHNYPYAANYRYTLQRATGMIAAVFIAIHVFHMHGWIHNESWLHYVVEPLGGAQFRAYNATSTAGLALQNVVMVVIYAIGITACVYHLANGIWTMGITWGVWISPPAQARALKACMTFGVLLALVTAGALFGMRQAGRPPELEQAIEVEDKMYESRIETGEIEPNEHKRSATETETESAPESESESAPKE